MYNTLLNRTINQLTSYDVSKKFDQLAGKTYTHSNKFKIKIKVHEKKMEWYKQSNKSQISIFKSYK